MRFIPTRVHAIIDYVVGIVLILAPWLLGFAHGGPETWAPVIIGAGTILYSLFTDYEYGVMRLIPVPLHLTLDAIAGAFLLVSPWILNYADIVWVPHVVVGAFEIFAALTTRLHPEHHLPHGRTPQMG